MLNMLLKRLSENNQLVLDNNSLSGQFYVNSDVLRMLFKIEADAASENSASCADLMALCGKESGVQQASEAMDFFDSQTTDYFMDLNDAFDILTGIDDNNLADNANLVNVGSQFVEAQVASYGAKYVNEYSQTNTEPALEAKAKCQELCCLLNSADNAYEDFLIS